jgi:hypothetical protein
VWEDSDDEKISCEKEPQRQGVSDRVREILQGGDAVGVGGGDTPNLSDHQTIARKRARSPDDEKANRSKERDVWIAKYAEFTSERIAAGGFAVNCDGLPMMVCVKCGEMKERTPDNFHPNKAGRTMKKWFSDDFPWMNNSARFPCRPCKAHLLRVRNNDPGGDAYLVRLVGRHKNISLEWAKQWFDLAAGALRCPATGGTLPFQKGNNAFSLGINSTALQFDTKYTLENKHALDDVEPCYQFANCMQTVTGPNKNKVVIIPSLREAYTELYKRVIETFEVGRAETELRGDETAKRMKATADFNHMTQSARKTDKKRGFYIDNNVSAVRVLDMVRLKHAVCCITGIVMTSFSASGGVRGPFDVHMNRIEDAWNSSDPKGHVEGNIEFTVRMFNNNRHISRKDFILLFLNQVLVPLPERVRTLAKEEYDAIPCSSRDAWKHV